MNMSESELNNVPFGIERVRRTIQSNIIRMREIKRNEELQKILFEKEYDHFVTEWIRKLFGLYGIECSELNIIMFKHMLYSIKRSVFGYAPPKCRFMYSFYSRVQGIGKSCFVEHTCDPFRFLFSNQGTLDMLIKKNDLKALISEKRVIDIQELATEGDFDRSSYAALKAAITSDTVGGRVLYTSESEDVKNYSVFMSSTNIHIADMIQDDTGLRRFFSFDFHKKPSDWNAVDKHWSFLPQVYRYIDETGSAPLNDKMEIFGELEKIQEGYKRRTDFIAEWQNMSGYKIVRKPSRTSTKMNKTELFNLLKEHCKTYENFNLRMGVMKTILISRHEIYPETSENGMDIYYVECPSPAAIRTAGPSLPDNAMMGEVF